MISQYSFSWWLGVIRHQDITWTNADQALWWHMVSLGQNELTHWGWVIHKCVNNLTNIASYNGLLPGLPPSHYLHHCWNIVNWTLKNKLYWNFYWNSYIFIQENAFENVVWKMTATLSRPQCVNSCLCRPGCGSQTTTCMILLKMYYISW